MITVSMHRAASVKADISDDKAHAWMTFREEDGSNFCIFFDPSKFEAAKAMAEFFNDNLAEQPAPAPQDDDPDFSDFG